MSFFNKFPLLAYKFDTSKITAKLAVNITNSVKFIDLFPEKSDKCYVDYIVKDGEKPEHIAHRIYGRADYHWVILMSNQIYNPYFDWPLSDAELQEYVADKYKGTAIFFDCIGGESTNFYIDGTQTLLNVQKSNFVPGNTISQIQSSNTTVTATILEWDATYRKLVVDDVSGGMFVTGTKITSNNIDGKTFYATPKKVVIENTEAVHHFVDDFNNILDPYGKINYYEYDDNKIFVTQNIFYNNESGIPSSFTTGITGTNDFILNKYINGSQTNTITNRKNEEIENNIKRTVKILKPEYAIQVIKDMENVFNK
jgi:hypothetical protein